MNSSGIRDFVALPISCGVRRTALLSGVIVAAFTGGLPLDALHPALVMGRPVGSSPWLAFVFHLALSVLYAVPLSLAIVRSRGGLTLFLACLSGLALALANAGLSRELGIPCEWLDPLCVVSHLIFAISFTLTFKLAEIGVREPDGPLPSTRLATPNAAVTISRS
jgi:hypothetical protein